MHRSKRFLRLISCCGIVAAGFLLPARLTQAQAVESAEGPHHALWAGGEFASFQASFPYQSGQRLTGMSGFGDFHLNPRIDLEAKASFFKFNSFHGLSEGAYLAGPEYRFGRFGNFEPFADFLCGIAKIQYPFKIGSGQFLALAPGGGANYRISRRLSLRGSFQYQLWLNSPNITNEPAHRLAPSGFYVGVSYRLHR